MTHRQLDLVKTHDGRNYLIPFILVTTLFFLWGFAHSILDVLNKHFQDDMNITKTESALVQAVVYGGYFLMAIPAGRIIQRFGYRAGVLTGLVLYGVGALLFVPGGEWHSFPFFLLCLFIIGCGLTCLETAGQIPMSPYSEHPKRPKAASTFRNRSTDWDGFADRSWEDGSFSMVKGTSPCPMPSSAHWYC